MFLTDMIEQADVPTSSDRFTLRSYVVLGWSDRDEQYVTIETSSYKEAKKRAALCRYMAPSSTFAIYEMTISGTKV